MSKLSEKKCVPCEGGVPALKGNELTELFDQLGEGWKIIEDHHIEKTFKFKNFKKALDFTNTIGEIAETEGHHPDIHLSWGKVKVTLWTHIAFGLTQNDFILAAKIDEL